MAESPRVGEFASTPTSAAGVSSAATTTTANGEIRTFPNTLWDQVERVYLRLTKGRHDLKRVKAYMEARAEMARTWAKSMNKASAQPELEDSSSLGALWHDMKETGVAQAKQQEAFAVVCMEIAAALEAQIVEVKKQKTSLHERWTRLLADVKKKQQAHDKALRDYQESVKQAETAIMNRDSTHEQKMPDKAIQKAEKTAKSALAVVDSQHAAYQKSVQQLQEVQAQQDATCADLLTQFERLERTRMRTFLEQLDRWASQHDTLKAQLDSVAASLHTHANAVNIDADMQEFIRANNTGKVPPPHVEYVPCRSQILDHANGGVGASATQNVSGNLAAPVATFVPPSPGNQANVMASSPAAAAPSAISLAAAGPSAPVGGALAGGDVAVALYDFDANEPDDLGFKAGATIKLTMCSDAEDWWQGELNGKTGIFPKAYVQKQGAAPNTAGAPAGSAAALSAAPIAAHASEAVAAEGVVAQPGVVAGAPVAPAAAAAGGAGGAEVPKLLDAQCAALFDFDGQDEDELSFKAGQNLIITGELNGWYLGKVEGSEKVGIFPSNFVQMSGR